MMPGPVKPVAGKRKASYKTRWSCGDNHRRFTRLSADNAGAVDGEGFDGGFEGLMFPIGSLAEPTGPRGSR
jgi:hypothetical protein